LGAFYAFVKRNEKGKIIRFGRWGMYETACSGEVNPDAEGRDWNVKGSDER